MIATDRAVPAARDLPADRAAQQVVRAASEDRAAPRVALADMADREAPDADPVEQAVDAALVEAPEGQDRVVAFVVLGDPATPADSEVPEGTEDRVGQGDRVGREVPEGPGDLAAGREDHRAPADLGDPGDPEVRADRAGREGGRGDRAHRVLPPTC